MHCNVIERTSLEGDLEGILFVGAMLTEGMADTEG